MINQEKMREEFEEWNGTYNGAMHEKSWNAWQASRAQSDAEIAKRDAIISMQTEVLKELMDWQVKNVHVWHNSAYDRAHDVISASAEFVAAWEAEKLLQLQRHIASIYKAFNFAIEMAREGDDSDIKAAHQKVVEAIANTQATAEAYDREHAVKVIVDFKRELSCIQEDASCLCTACWQHVEKTAGKAINELRAANEKKEGE